MLQPKQLKVKAIKRYSRAKYPSHQDPDPLLNRTPVPYPFHLKTLACAAAVASCLPVAGEQPKKNKSVEEPPARFAASRFASPRVSYFYRPQAFAGLGYGVMPGMIADPIDMAMARETIFNAFKKEHVRLTPTLTFEGDGIRFVADGYSPKKHMGFVMIEGKESKLVWAGLPIRDKLEMQNYLANEHLYRLLANLAAKVGYKGFVPLWYAGEIPERYPKEHDTRREFAASHPIETEASVFIVHEFPDSMAKYDKLQERFLEKYAETLRADWEQSKLESHKTVLEKLSAETGPPESRLPDGLRLTIDKALKSDALDEVLAALEECRASRLAWNGRESLEPVELSEIDTLAKERKEYIAVISRSDIEFRYPTDGDRDTAMQRAIEAALKDLEDKVRSYIRWARHQGLQ